jgi:hypothetical protein
VPLKLLRDAFGARGRVAEADELAGLLSLLAGAGQRGTTRSLPLGGRHLASNTILVEGVELNLNRREWLRSCRTPIGCLRREEKRG